MFVWSITLIFLPMTYNCYLHVFFFILYKRYTNEVAKIPITQLSIGIYNNYSCMQSFIFVENSTTYLKVSATSSKYYYYIISWKYYHFILFLCFNFYNTIIQNKKSSKYLFVSYSSTETQIDLKGQEDYFERGWFIIWNWPVFFVTKFSLV